MNTTTQETSRQEFTNGSESLSSLYSTLYPSQPALITMFKAPLLLWRLGLGKLIGQMFMVITTTGRKSVLPRRTVVEYRLWFGRKYAFAAWPKSDWYRNIQADPYVTIQTRDGAESVIARRVTDELELIRLYDLVQNDPTIKGMAQMLGFELTRQSFLEQSDKFHLLVFEPTDEPTPLPLEPDLVWLWPVALVIVFVGMLLGRRAAE